MATRSGTNAALVVVDVQTGVVATAWDRDRILANIARAVERARAAGVPVIWVQHEDEDLPRDSADWKWVPELEAMPGELWIHKHFNSSFEDTALLAELDRLGVSRLFLAGAATNWCIRATAYGALERGFDLTLLSDAHTTKDLRLTSGRVVAAQLAIDDLNAVLQWLAYPGRTNTVVPVAEAEFG